MGILNRLRNALAQPTIGDAHFYALIAKEIDSGYIREGLWAKAMVEANFDKSKGRATYMRMAVKALQQELREQAEQEAARQRDAMENAIALYEQGEYSAATEGLALCIERKNDGLSMVCLANIAWHGLNGEIDRDSASDLLLGAEQSRDGNVRRYLGVVYEAIDWRKSLESYDFAAKQGNRDAATSCARSTKASEDARVASQEHYRQTV